MAVASLTLAGAMAASCGGDNGEPREVTLGEVVADQSRFDGQVLQLKGEVVGFDNPEHYVIEDAAHNRVELRPVEAAAAWSGQTVTVVGRYSFSETEGRRIEIEEIAPAPSR
jgi:hypothetical protein